MIFLLSLKDKIHRAKPNIADYKVMQIVKNALQTHPRYRDLCTPKFPRMLAEVRLALEEYENQSSQHQRSTSHVFSLEDKIAAREKQLGEVTNALLQHPQGQQRSNNNKPQQPNRPSGNASGNRSANPNDKWCSYHRSKRHTDQECLAQKKQQGQSKSGQSGRSTYLVDEPTHEERSSSSTDSTSSEN